jgi:nitroreductase
MLHEKSFREVVRTRRSARAFLPTPVADQTIVEVLKEAQMAPSNCNTQPWIVHMVGGAKRNELANALLAAAQVGDRTPDFPFARDAYQGVYQDRNAQQAKTYYEALGAARGDKEAREAAYLRNFEFFGAPHAAFLFIPYPYDVRVAGDVGMFAQTYLLSLASRGLAGIPQTSLSYFAETVRTVLGVSSDLKLLMGISFGYADEGFKGHGFHLGRAELSESVTFHR